MTQRVTVPYTEIDFVAPDGIKKLRESLLQRTETIVWGWMFWG